MGPGIRKGVQINGLQLSVFDIAPTILHVYGIEAPVQMQGRILSEIFRDGPALAAKTSQAQPGKTEHTHPH